jgi:hypothetical protein
MSDPGNGSEELERAGESPRGLRAIRGATFKGVAPIAPSGWVIEKEAPWHLSAAYMYAMGSCKRNSRGARQKPAGSFQSVPPAFFPGTGD